MNLLLCTIFIPFVVALAIALIGEKNAKLRNVLLMGISIFVFFAVLSQVRPVLDNELVPFILADLDFFKIAFAVDAFSMMIGCLITFLWIFTTSYSIGYMEGEHALPRFFTSLTVCLGATMGIIFAANLMTFFIFKGFLFSPIFPACINDIQP